MKFNFLPRQKRQKYFVWALIAIVCIGAIMVWYGYFRQETILFFQPEFVPLREITVDLSILEDPIFEELGIPVSEIPTPDPGKRVNPFIAN
jgi:hypothetical protein